VRVVVALLHPAGCIGAVLSSAACCLNALNGAHAELLLQLPVPRSCLPAVQFHLSCIAVQVKANKQHPFPSMQTAAACCCMHAKMPNWRICPQQPQVASKVKRKLAFQFIAALRVFLRGPLCKSQGIARCRLPSSSYSRSGRRWENILVESRNSLVACGSVFHNRRAAGSSPPRLDWNVG
jgi:hypothetical protein